MSMRRGKAETGAAADVETGEAAGAQPASQAGSGKAKEDSTPSLQVPLAKEDRIKLEFLNISSWAIVHPEDQPGKKKEKKEKKKETAPKAEEAKESKGEKEYKQILFNISGACNPGELMALMGPSGSGKTTLMSTISGRPAEGMSHKGSVRYNGNSLTDQMRKKVGYVPQDDVLYRNLTVYETLYYAARLALPAKWSTEDKKRLVEEAMELLGLTHRRDTPVIANRKTVSGGERKRVSVAHEMLTNPSVLFLDEPTSGLDSTAALILVKALKKLARRGRTVIATIHQPNAHTFSAFDKLMVLSRGEAMFYGHRTACLDWLKSLDAPCPPGINTAEFVIDVAACFVGPQGGKSNSGEAVDPKTRRNELVKAYNLWMNSSYSHVEFGVTSKDIDQGPKLLQTIRQETTDEPEKKPTLVLPASDSDGDLSKQQGVKPKGEMVGLNWFQQFGVLYSRIVASRKAEAINKQKIGLIVGWGLLAGILWLGDGMHYTVEGANNVAGLFFLLCLQLVVQNIMAPIFMFPQEMGVVKKERSGSLYSLSAYYTARSASEFQLECLLPIVQATIIYIFALLRPSLLAYLATLAVVVLVVFASQGLGHLLSTAILDPDTRSITFALTTQFSAMVCGFVLVLPFWINWAKYLSVLWYGYNLLLFIQYQGVPLQDCDATGECIVVDWTTALAGRVNPTMFEWVEVLAFFLFILGTRFAAFSVLKFRTTAGKA